MADVLVERFYKSIGGMNYGVDKPKKRRNFLRFFGYYFLFTPPG